MILIADKFGQLANRLFVFAHFIGWGIEHGVVIANPAFDEYAQYFEGTADDPCVAIRSGQIPPGMLRDHATGFTKSPDWPPGSETASKLAPLGLDAWI